MSEQDIASFADLKSTLRKRAQQGERFLGFDIKPPFPDTPGNWEDELESVFTSRI